LYAFHEKLNICGNELKKEGMLGFEDYFLVQIKMDIENLHFSAADERLTLPCYILHINSVSAEKLLICINRTLQRTHFRT
jgi:hypothetical protein